MCDGDRYDDRVTEEVNRRIIDHSSSVLMPYTHRSAAELNDDAAALAYACEIVRELLKSLARTERNSLVKVRDETRRMVLAIAFLAACA